MTPNAEFPGAPEGAPPQTLGHYVIEGELGRGGMGVVYLARDRKLDRQVAIKTLPAELARDPEQLGRFEREAKLLASLNHPNIATIHGLEESADATRYLILERVEGETLADRLLRGSLPIEETLQVCEQVADALDAAHERGVIHRDLKPRNVMITPGGRVKVLDFGLAKRTSDEAHAGADDGTMTEAGVVVGTPGYMSPEQVLAQPQDARTDVFAFGCVLFECLSGMKAFEADSTMMLVALVLSGEPDWTKLPEGPAGFRHLIERCLEKDPERRLATMHDVRRALRGLMAEHVTGQTSAIAALAGTQHNLPREVASFVGRERELEECGRLLEQTRFLTLTGAGGSGKTRLALRLAHGLIQTFPGGVWFVDLGPLSDPTQVARAAAQALGVREESGRTLERGLAERLGGPAAVLMLDNCEHVLATCGALVDGLLQACENLKVIATSREALNVAGEQVFAVPTLSFPDPGARLSVEAIAQYASVRLFVERAVQVQATFKLAPGNAAAVADICRRLDGIPLAIELAAARVKVLAVEQIRAKLDDRFRLLTGGSKAALPRQQTLQAAIQWSYDHLHPEEQQLMRSLAVFAGGWSLEAATLVYGVSDDEFEVLDLLTRLVDKSLVVVDHSRADEPRYRYLETVRQYALERIRETDEATPARTRHLRFFSALATKAEPALRGAEQVVWVRRLNSEHENLQAALTWRESGDGDTADLHLELGGAMWRYWLMSGHLGLGRRLLGEVLQAYPSGSALARAKVTYGAALLAFSQGDYDAAQRGIEECLPHYRDAGDGERMAACLGMLGNIAGERGDFDHARTRYEEALAICRKAQYRRGVAIHLNNLALLARRQRDLPAARAMFDEAAGEMRSLGDVNSLAIALGNLANIATEQGELPAARAYLVEDLKIIQDLESPRPGIVALEVASDLADVTGHATRAVTLRGAADTIREAAGIPVGAAERAAQEETVARLRSKVGEQAFLQAWEVGRAMDVGTAVSHALEWLESATGAERSAAS
jgi:non-specific serine/threonine protein kinase